MIMILVAMLTYVFTFYYWRAFLEECAKPKYPPQPLQTKQSRLKLFERIDD